MFPFPNCFRSLVKWTGRSRRTRPTPWRRFARYHLTLESLETRAVPSTTWTGTSSNPHTDNWSDSRNWTNGVPGANNPAIFTSTSGSHTAVVDQAFTVLSVSVDGNWGGTISVDHPLSITGGLSLASGGFGGGAALNIAGGLTMAGGNLGGSEAVTIAGTSRWTGGTITIGFRNQLTLSGTLTLANPASNLITLNGDGTLVNTGTIVQAGANDLNIQSSGIANLTTLLNQGTYDFQTDTSISSNSGGGTFNNQGILSKSAGRSNASSAMAVLLKSSSEIDVSAGVLSVASDGSVLTGGTFNVAAGAILNLTGGRTVNYTGVFTGSGDGTIAVSSGDLEVTSAGSTFDFPAPLFKWSGGFITIPYQSQLTNADTFTLTNNATTLVNLRGDGTLVNAGTIEQDGASDLNIQSNGLGNLTTLLNQGTYDFQTDTGISSNSGGGTFNNQGTLSKSAGRANDFSAISVILNSSSEIAVNAGNLRFAGDGSLLNGGNFDVAAGSTLDLTGGRTLNYTGTFTGHGAGAVALTGGDLEVTSAGATFAFDPGLFQWTGGFITVPYQGQPLTNAGDMTLANSGLVNLRGDGTLLNAGTIEQVGPGDLNIQSNGLANLTTLLNQGSYSIQNDSGISSNSGGGTFNNQGVLSKDAGSPLSFSAISVLFQNSSEIDANVGNLTLASDGGTLTGGTLNAAAGATLDLTGNRTVNYSGTFTGSGGGAVVLSSGDLEVDPIAGVTFAFPAGLFQWTGGFITVPFQGMPFTNTGDMTLANTGLVTLRGDGTFINAGTIEQTGPGDLNIQSFGISNLTTLVNQAGAVYDIQADSGISSNSGGGTVMNQGTLQKSAGNNTSTISVVFNNSDTPANPNSDLVLARHGRLDLTNFSQTAGAINLAGGAVGAGNNGTLAIAGGLLEGTGEVFANFVNGGTVSPGGDGAIGTLTIHGNYTQTSSGTLNIDLASASSFDRLLIDVAASLAGALHVNLINGFMPSHNQTFTIMTFGSHTGNFTSVTTGFGDTFAPDDKSMNLVAS